MASEIKKPKEPTPRAPRTIMPVHRVDPDWQAFYENFCQAHTYREGGGVVDGGRIIFSDGWSCSADNWQGPYVEPPKSLGALIEMKIKYWRRRLMIVKAERDKLSNMLEGLSEEQRKHQLPLQVRAYYIEEKTGYLRKTTSEVDWGAMTVRLRWLIEDVQLCEKELFELGERP